MASLKIQKITAREILDSRGNPTIEVTVTLKDGTTGVASVPSGASTGVHEALELRDGGRRYNGKGVQRAVKNVNTTINRLLKGIKVTDQQDIDMLMLKKDGTDNKSVLGANALLGVSLACARTGAQATSMPLYAYLRKVYKISYKGYTLPRPMMNILNGGAHAHWALDIQEFMIVPKNISFSKMVQMGSEIFHQLGENLQSKKLPTGKGDEGGYAVPFKKNEEAFQTIIKAIKDSGYRHGVNVDVAIDAASSEFYAKKKYMLTKPKKSLSSTQMIKLLLEWQKKYKLISIEDGLSEDDWKHWPILTKELTKRKVMDVGDDLFVTNAQRLERGVDEGVGNAILIKLNQIGTLTETIKTIHMAKVNGYKVIISHRSGETADTFIADLAVAVNADYIKTGSLSRSERVEKYNRLMKIEEEV
jgi:enolase